MPAFAAFLATSLGSAQAAPSPASIDLDLLLEERAGRSDAPHVALWPGAPDPSQLRPKTPPIPDKEPWAALSAGPPPSAGPAADHPGATPGGLSGKAVYVSQCHGWQWYDSLGRFSTQRGILFDTIEDFHNPEGANHYLLRYLENAGAATFTARERDWNPEMAIADNDGEGYGEAGSGFVDGGAGFAEGAPYALSDLPFSAGTTRRFPADGGGVATWTPEVPKDGFYAVYVSWDSAPDNALSAHYRLTHSGGVIDRSFDQTVHGSTWQYVEHLWLPAGVGGLTVELVGDSGEAGRWLSADAVRIGGGIDDAERHGETTARPRWEASALHYTQFLGAPSSVFNDDGEGGYDPSARSRWAKWEHPSSEDAVYISWHSNAGGGTGTSTYVYEGSYTRTEGSLELGTLIQDELVEAIRSQWDGGWVDRGVRTAAFAEVSPAYNDEMPGVLVELAFHDHEGDTALLKHPMFRRDSARAMYRGIVRYFAERDGETPLFLPEAPEAVALLHDGAGDLVLSWEAGPVGDPFGDAPTSYVVYRSTDGRSWDSGTDVGAAREARLDAALGEVVYARVAARNAGGVSFPSEVVGARRSPNGKAEVLVVLGFDRLGTNLLWEDASPVGDVRRLDQHRINGFDHVIAHGEAVAAAGWFFESAADERLSGLDLSARARVLFWNAGEESTEDDTFTREHQALVRAFYEAGGALWVSGSEVLWDLDERGDADDLAFADEVLGVMLEADDAGTSLATGVGLLDGALFDFGVEDGAPYPAEWPDVLATGDDAVITYATGGVAATLGERRTHWGLPFECVGDPEARAFAVAALLPALVEGYTPPEVPDEPGDTADPDGDGGDGGGDGGADSDAPVEPPGTRYPPAQGCGCSTTPSAGAPAGVGLSLLALLGLGVARRRRQGAADPGR